MLHQVALVPHHLLAQAAQPLPTLKLVAGRLDEAVHIFYTRKDWNKAEEEITEAFDQAVESFKDILDDESSLDEVFSISGNDLPAYGDEVKESQLF